MCPKFKAYALAGVVAAFGSAGRADAQAMSGVGLGGNAPTPRVAVPWFAPATVPTNPMPFTPNPATPPVPVAVDPPWVWSVPPQDSLAFSACNPVGSVGQIPVGGQFLNAPGFAPVPGGLSSAVVPSGITTTAAGAAIVPVLPGDLGVNTYPPGVTGVNPS